MHENLNKIIAISQFPTIVEGAPAAGGLVDFNATGDKFSIAPVAPIDIVRFGIIVKTAMNPDAGGFVLALDYRPTVGSDTNRVQKDVLTRADAELVAAGGIVYRSPELPVAASAVSGAPGIGGQSVYVGPSGPVRINPGEEAVLEVTNAVGAASDGYVFIEYIQHGVDDYGFTTVSEDVT